MDRARDRRSHRSILPAVLTRLKANRAEVVWGALIALAILFPWLFFGMYAGDGVIHLVYAENASRGNWFEFNLGEKSSGETSPGTMLLLAGLYRLSPPNWVPLLVKLLNLAAWFAMCWVFYRLARRFLPKTIARGAAVVAALLPGSVYNANVGMEAGLFGLLVMLWLGRVEKRRNWSAGLLLGVGAWVRPEAGLMALLWGGFLLFEAGRGASTWSRVRGWLWRFGAAFLLPAGLLLFFLHYQTGAYLPTSALARIMAGEYAARWGWLHVSWRLGLRLAAYAPLTLAAVAGGIDAFRSPNRPALLRFAAWSVVWLSVAFSTVLPDVHLARYSVFWMPMLVLLAGCGLAPRGAEFRGGTRWPVIAAAIVLLLGVFAWETHQRLQLGSRSALASAMAAPPNREAATAQLLEGLGTRSETVRMAAVEVQIRYWLDERVRVYSLDGRTDRAALDFQTHRGFDLMAYLRFRKIDVLRIDFPSSLEMIPKQLNRQLRELRPGARLQTEGLVFERLRTGPFLKVELQPVTRQTATREAP